MYLLRLCNKKTKNEKFTAKRYKILKLFNFKNLEQLSSVITTYLNFLFSLYKSQGEMPQSSHTFEKSYVVKAIKAKIISLEN